MKKIIIITLILISTNVAIGENFYSGLERLERQLLQSTYEYDIPEDRIERLEVKLFGTSQNGTLTDRYNLLKSASKNYRAYSPEYNYNRRQQVYNQYRPPIFTGSTGSSWKNMLWGNFMNQFTGYPTGLTPAISQGMDPAYMDYFEAERALMNSSNGSYEVTPRGYRTKRLERGAKTGVTILD